MYVCINMFINFVYNNVCSAEGLSKGLLAAELYPLLVYTADTDCVSFQVPSSLTQKTSCDRIAQLQTEPSHLIQQQLHNVKDDNRKLIIFSRLNHMIYLSLVTVIA